MAQGSKLFPLPQKAHHFLEQKTAKPIMLFVAWIFFPKTNMHPERIIGSQIWCFGDAKEPCKYGFKPLLGLKKNQRLSLSTLSPKVLVNSY